MIRFAVAVISALLCLGQITQAQVPQVSFELDSETAIVGQPVTLRIKVLVPTWMPKPAVFPNVEVPSLMVRLPERATAPISETIDRATWSGVQRAYRLYPLAAGNFALPDGEIVVTYADPDSSDPLVYRAPLPAVRFTAAVPAAAQGLDPPIIAGSFALEQALNGETAMQAGDAITRSITARIDGTTPVLIPALTPEPATAALRAYDKEPVITETENSGDLSGTRVETTTYVGQQDGQVTLPPVTLDWFNLSTGKVETATLPGVDITVTGGGLAANPPSATDVAAWVAAAGAAALLFSLAWRFARPPLLRSLDEAWARYHASERAAHRRLMRALEAHALSESLSAAEDWADFFSHMPGAAAPVQNALAEIGATRFGGQTDAGKAAWSDAVRAARSARAAALRQESAAEHTRALPPLNP